MTRLRAFHIAVIIFAGISVYAGTLHYSFHFDDEPNIVENQNIKDLGNLLDSGNLHKFLSGNRSVGYLSFALNYFFHGLDVEGYHIVNIALHITNALLIYWLITCLFKITEDKNTGSNSSFISLGASLLFVCHPIQIQAVTYIVQRFAVLASAFYLFALISYIKARTATDGISFKSLSWYLLSVLCAILAFRSKEMALTLPISIAACEYIFFRSKVSKNIIRLTPLLLIAFVITLSYIGHGNSMEELTRGLEEKLRSETSMPRSDYLLTQSRVIMTYLRLLFLPINQNFDYDYPVYHSLSNSVVILSILFLLSLIGLGLYISYRFRYGTEDVISVSYDSPASDLRLIGFGIIWFFITLSVESSIIPIVDVINEHRLYLPSIGIFIALSGAGSFFVSYYDNANGHKILKTIFFTLIILLSIACIKRNSKWETDISIWSDVASKSPNKARGFYNLGHAYGRENRYDLAIDNYTKALKNNPRHIKAFINRGNAYDEIGQTISAMQDYQSALAIDPSEPLIYFNRGVTSYRNGMLKYAKIDFEEACRLGYNEGCNAISDIRLTNQP